MTLEEAQRRARELWTGRVGVWSVQMLMNGGAIVHVHPGESTYQRHELDTQGQPVCHDECRPAGQKRSV
jgi:hypothetical protein